MKFICNLLINAERKKIIKIIMSRNVSQRSCLAAITIKMTNIQHGCLLADTYN